MNILFTNRDDWQPKLESAAKTLNATPIFADFSPAEIAKADYLFPIGIKDVLKASEHLSGKNLFPTIELIHTCEDKLKFEKLLYNHGLSKYSPYMDKAHRRFPYVLKGKQGEFGNNTFIVKNIAEELEISEKLKSPDYYLQKYISGSNEYALHFLFDGEGFRYFQEVKYEYGKEFAIKSPLYIPVSQTWSATSLWRDDIAHILKTIGYTGIGCLNYKVENNQLYIIELNARIGGSMMPRVHELIQVFIKYYDETLG